MKRFRSVTLLFFVVAWSGVALAWSEAGHRIVALIAYERLSAEERAAVLELLEFHPRFDQDFRIPAAVQKAGDEMGDRWLFARAAAWPDLARGYEGELELTYHHPTWHYVNLPIFLDPTDLNVFPEPVRNPPREWRSGMRSDRMNIMQALQKAADRLDRDGVSRRERALDLSWTFHLVGDLHQPLHSVALFSTAALPEGDRGGNRLRPDDDDASSLHQLWDGIFGARVWVEELLPLVGEMLNDPTLGQAGAEAAGEPDRAVWLQESFEVAVESVYTSSILDHVRALDKEHRARSGARERPTDIRGVPVDQAYRDRALELARRRVVQAGYRLAALVRSWELTAD